MPRRTPTTSYVYDPIAQLLTVTDAQGNATSMHYDLLGRRTSLSNPDAGLVTFVYDGAGNLVLKQDSNLRAKHAAITYDYVFDQLRAVRFPFSTIVTYEYGGPGDVAENQVGRVKRITDDAGEETRGYGKLGETARSTRTVKPLKPNGAPQTFETRFAFDSFGRMTSMMYPDGETLTYHYDAGGLVAGATGSRPATKHYAAAKETYLASLTYDEFGQRKTLVYCTVQRISGAGGGRPDRSRSVDSRARVSAGRPYRAWCAHVRPLGHGGELRRLRRILVRLLAHRGPRSPQVVGR